jgi:hypothetical protein
MEERKKERGGLPFLMITLSIYLHEGGTLLDDPVTFGV